MMKQNNTDFIDTTTGEPIDLAEIEFEPIEIESDEPAESPQEQLEVISVKRESTRGRLALAFLLGFFFMLVGGLIIAGINDGDKVEGAKEILLTISGILSGPLGFVIGYYFRSTEE